MIDLWRYSDGTEMSTAAKIGATTAVGFGVILFVLLVLFAIATVMEVRTVRQQTRDARAAELDRQRRREIEQYLEPDDVAWLAGHGYAPDLILKDTPPAPGPFTTPTPIGQTPPSNAASCVCGDSDEPHDPATHTSSVWPGVRANRSTVDTIAGHVSDAMRYQQTVARRVASIESKIVAVDPAYADRHYTAQQIAAMRRMTKGI